jgi:hypothetical protein
VAGRQQAQTGKKGRQRQAASQESRRQEYTPGIEFIVERADTACPLAQPQKPKSCEVDRLLCFSGQHAEIKNLLPNIEAKK